MPQNTYVINNESSAEMARLSLQDRELNKVTPSLPDPSAQMILDLACGPGGWVLNLARESSSRQVVGVDISHIIIDYAKAQALDLKNATFRIMDITKPRLDFADNLFDLINGRLLFGVLSPHQWPQLLTECLRIVKPGGYIQLTEPEFPVTTSMATEALYTHFLHALQKTGRSSLQAPSRTLGITAMLRKYLRDAGCIHLETHASCIDYSFGTAAHDIWCENTEIGFSLLTPFLLAQKVTTSEEINHLLEKLKQENQSTTFYGIHYLLTAVGKKPTTSHHKSTERPDR